MRELTGMAGHRVLLDTVMVIAYLKSEQTVLNRLQGLSVYVASITIGEMFFGAYKSSRVNDNLRELRGFIASSNITIIDCDTITGDYYGQIKQSLKRKGRPIPENDIWIAATALQHGLTLISRDAHFNEVDGLDLTTW